MTTSALLSHEELVALTDYELPARQARWLDERGWRYERGASGKVKVSRAHFETMMGGGAAKAPGPNFAAIGG